MIRLSGSGLHIYNCTKLYFVQNKFHAHKTLIKNSNMTDIIRMICLCHIVNIYYTTIVIPLSYHETNWGQCDYTNNNLIRVEMKFARPDDIIPSQYTGPELLLWGNFQWGRDKVAAILQTIFFRYISWIKMHEFRLGFHLSLFQSIISQHWFR